MCMYKIIWLDGASGVGKTTVANFLTNELMEHGLTVDNVDSDYYYQEKYLSNPKIDQSKIKSPWADECFLKYFKGQLVLFCEKNDILVVQMALTYDKCRKKLLESLGEKVAIKHIILNLANSLDSDMDYLCVMGIEGNAAKVYFPRMFDNVSWNGRKPRIKSDYLNVTLDIGYTMLFNIVDAMLQVYGFDTYYGVFHRCFYMRKSLVCDLMEPMRPIVDYAIRKAINLGQCKMDDFELYGTRWCLKMKNNASYIQFIMAAILDYKDDIFLYIQRYYRFFMKRKSVEQLPTFELH